MPLFAETDLGTTFLVLLIVVGRCGRGAMKMRREFDNGGSIHSAAKEGFETTAKKGVGIFLKRWAKR